MPISVRSKRTEDASGVFRGKLGLNFLGEAQLDTLPLALVIFCGKSARWRAPGSAGAATFLLQVRLPNPSGHF